jgi:hypothetical protein
MKRVDEKIEGKQACQYDSACQLSKKIENP